MDGRMTFSRRYNSTLARVGVFDDDKIIIMNTRVDNTQTLKQYSSTRVSSARAKIIIILPEVQSANQPTTKIQFKSTFFNIHSFDDLIFLIIFWFWQPSIILLLAFL